MTTRAPCYLKPFVLVLYSTKLPKEKLSQLAGHRVSINFVEKLSPLHQDNVHKCQNTLKFTEKHSQLKQNLWKFWPTNVVPVASYIALVEEATRSMGTTVVNWSDFLLHKLQSYGEALNLRGAMAFLYFHHLWYIAV